MFKTLYARLAAGLVTLVAVLTLLYVLVTLYASRLYYQEVNQELNQTLAANLIVDKHLAFRDGVVDRTALARIFDTYMVINPSIEVYMLDRNGGILAYSAPPGKVKRDRVNLAPVNAFLSGASRLPILGDDPRDMHREKVFSVAAVGPASDPHGYLYVVLAGEQADSVTNMLQGSYIMRLVILGLAASSLVCLSAGLLLLRGLTRRLQVLDGAMTAFEDSDQRDFMTPVDLDTNVHDEFGRLGRSFVRLVGKINAQVGELKRTDALRRELVANVSHDLRNPVTSLQTYIETILMKSDQYSDEERRRHLEVAMHQSRRLGKLIDELFELATLDSGFVPLRVEEFSLAELVQDVTLKYRLRGELKGVMVAADIPRGLPFINADIGLIERVLDNLLENSLRYTAFGGRIDVTLEQHGEAVRVCVSDTGCGIPTDELPHVFDRFYRVHGRDGQSDNGVGLGLAIVRSILTRHAGTIEITSTLHTGTRAVFTLPVTPPP
jgi:signal transduction histidine kinase